MNYVIDMKTGKEVTAMPGGIVGQISLHRLIEQLRKAGEFPATETVTHLRFDFSSGVIQYRVE